ncbi:hypothetical protein Q1695_003442 [Nippostrongylus brasiliensis]|nr:hypothetical protein Q1695_003442 [Nippostrongylus brasiliensis]
MERDWPPPLPRRPSNSSSPQVTLSPYLGTRPSLVPPTARILKRSYENEKSRPAMADIQNTPVTAVGENSRELKPLAKESPKVEKKRPSSEKRPVPPPLPKVAKKNNVPAVSTKQNAPPVPSTEELRKRKPADFQELLAAVAVDFSAPRRIVPPPYPRMVNGKLVSGCVEIPAPKRQRKVSPKREAHPADKTTPDWERYYLQDDYGNWYTGLDEFVGDSMQQPKEEFIDDYRQSIPNQRYRYDFHDHSYYNYDSYPPVNPAPPEYPYHRDVQPRVRFAPYHEVYEHNLQGRPAPYPSITPSKLFTCEGGPFYETLAPPPPPPDCLPMPTRFAKF